jgi:leader peptidase (prepilin peptidase)/N-methyltransferase
VKRAQHSKRWRNYNVRNIFNSFASDALGFAFLHDLYGVFSCQLLGSFLNVVVARIPLGMSVVFPPSRCPRCEKKILPRDNIPVFGWIVLKGKCRSCALPISKRYPLVEAAVGILGVLIVYQWGFTLDALQWFVFSFFLIAIALIDFDTWTIPLSLLAFMTILGGIFAGYKSWQLQNNAVWMGSIAGVLLGFAGLGFVVVISTWIMRKTGRISADEWAMGWGDPLLLGAIGAYVGAYSLILLPAVLFVASAIGAVLGIILKASGALSNRGPVSKEDPWIPPDGAMPFGPYLALGGLVVAFFYEPVLSLMTTLFPF